MSSAATANRVMTTSIPSPRQPDRQAGEPAGAGDGRRGRRADYLHRRRTDARSPYGGTPCGSRPQVGKRAALARRGAERAVLCNARERRLSCERRFGARFSARQGRAGARSWRRALRPARRRRPHRAISARRRCSRKSSAGPRERNEAPRCGGRSAKRGIMSGFCPVLAALRRLSNARTFALAMSKRRRFCRRRPGRSSSFPRRSRGDAARRRGGGPPGMDHSARAISKGVHRRARGAGGRVRPRAGQR